MQIAPINYIEIRDNRARIAGTGIKVANIAIMVVKLNTSIDWIVENYDLTPAQIHAALSYYYDHQEEIEQQVQDGEELARQYGTPSSEILERMRQRKNPGKSE